MSDKPKTPGQVCYEVCPDGACPFESLMPSEREMWERRAAAVERHLAGRVVVAGGEIATAAREQAMRTIGIGDPPPPPPPPPG
jgi:hypothetical protein